MDHRDRLILALSALVRAEREARIALEAAISSGELSPDTAKAMDNPEIVLNQDDMIMAEEFVRPYAPSSRLGIS
ncbi:hypothetical protein [Oryzicola mucosus]|uniref:Uncharacterized protein n=1 Tax=Oryzicola mucosus TaxID=2767425 RepID=A0A8J6PTK3_9HYPH|nr:hypothetical protein [Oryzicola mucosus]MBD0413222.1 hypothetical protein [Oryzicola mucosus]